MASSGYYYGQMQDYRKKKDRAKKDKDLYAKVLEKLKKLKENLPYAKLDLIAAENSFKSGGFIDKDETFDRGKLKENYDKIGTDIDELDVVISNIETKISELKDSITSYTSKYNTAESNYEAAKTREANARNA